MAHFPETKLSSFPPAVDSLRLAKAMERWRRRSRVIYFWRRALPGLMIVIAGGVLSMIVVNALFGPGRVADQNQQVRMLSPRFLGRDKNGRPYVVTAKEAVRDPAHSQLVTLAHPHLILQSLNGDPATVVDALHGLYNEDTHILVLDGKVQLDDGKRDLFESEHALVNTDQGTASSQTFVKATGPLGQTTASSYAVKDRGRDTEFIGDVKSHLVNN
jgi:lipopolysaccharide export system protein LptC